MQTEAKMKFKTSIQGSLRFSMLSKTHQPYEFIELIERFSYAIVRYFFN